MSSLCLVNSKRTITLQLVYYSTLIKYYFVVILIKINTYFSESASASGGLRPLDPLPGLRPWIPLGDSIPQTLSPDPLTLDPPATNFLSGLKFCVSLLVVAAVVNVIVTDVVCLQTSSSQHSPPHNNYQHYNNNYQHYNYNYQHHRYCSW